MTIKIKRTPQFETFGNELNPEVALLQAAAAIDMAVYAAVQSGNVEKMLDGAAMWIGLAERLANGLESEEDDSPVENSNKPPFGFTNDIASKPVEKTPDVIVEVEEEESSENA